MAAPEAKGSPGASLSPTECGGGSRVSLPPGSGHHSISPLGFRPFPHSPPSLMGTAIITWFISEETEKLISGASKGSSRKRVGPGPTESVSRPRRGEAIEREDTRSVHGGCEDRGAPPSVRGDSLARSLAGTAALKQQAEKLCPAVPSNRPPRASRRHCRNRGQLAPYPLARHHVRLRQPFAGASGTNQSANHRRAPERMQPVAPPTPCPALPRPAFLPRSLWFLLAPLK